MRAMKDSGIPWIGEIPANWQIERIKYLRNDEIDSFQDGDWIESPYITDTGIRYLTTGNVGDGFFKEQGNGYISDDTFRELGCKYAYPGDLVISRLNAPYGRACILPAIEDKYVLAVDIVILRTNHSKRFLCYLMQCSGYQNTVQDGAKGTTMKRISRTNLGNIALPIPSIEDQVKIASFLDDECARIDAVMEQTRTSIGEYKKLKQSVITQAVTKGIRPNRPMKDSGIDGIGEIPVSWDMVKLKYFLSNDKVNLRVGPFGSALSGTDFTSDGVWVYNQRVVLDNNFSENNTFVSEEKYEELKGFEVLPDDVLITTRGSIGKVAIVPTTAEKGILHPCVIKFRVNKDLITHTLIWHIFNNTDIAMRQIKDMSNSTTIEVLYSYSLRNVQIPLIPKDEWTEIEQFIEKTADEYNRLIDYKNQLLMELESYKRALIFECVTGKKEVV